MSDIVLTIDNQPIIVEIPKGLKGDKGDTGEQGVQGIQGIQGEKGDKGDAGEPASLANIDARIVVQLDTGGTIKAALDAKEPTITSGTTSQYLRGDKSWQTLDKTAVGLSNVVNVDTTTTANITDSADKRFVTDAQQSKFVAATTLADGYLTSTDWNTFTNKQAALGFNPENSANKSDDTTLAAGSSTLFPTQNAVKTYVLAGLAALTEFVTSTFRIKDSSDPTKKVSWVLTSVGTGTTKTITMPNANVNLGRIPVSQAFNSATGVITTTATDGTANPTVSIATGIVITIVSPTSPVAMSGLSSRAYILNGNTTFDLTGWSSDGSELLIKNGNVNTTYSVTITGVTADTFLSEGGLGGSHGVLGTGTVGVTLTLRCGEVFRVRPIGANLYRIFRSFAPWEQISDVKMYSTNTSALYSVSYAHASGANFTTNCVITVPNVAAVDLGKIPTALSYAASTGVVTLTNTDATTFTASLGSISDSIFRIQDNGDLTKQIAFEASAITTGTTRTVTMPNAAVNLGKIPTALSYSGSTLTMTTTDGLTLTSNITKPTPTKKTTSFTFASSNIVCRWDSGVTGAKTVTLPLSPLDGDTVELWDNEEASVYGSSGITTLTIIASGGTYILANPLTSYDVLSGVGGVAGMALRFVYRSATQLWSIQCFYADRFNSLDWYLEDGTNSARSIKYSLAALTAQRTITVPDANVNLGKIPTALSYSASTDVLTHTNTDGTTLTATIKAKRSLDYALSDQTTAITTGTPLTCRAPYAFTITGVKASLKTAQTSGSLFTLDIKKNGTSIFSTLLTFDNTEKTTATAATAAVLSSTTLADDDELTFIVTQVGDGTAIGLVAYIIGYPT